MNDIPNAYLGDIATHCIDNTRYTHHSTFKMLKPESYVGIGTSYASGRTLCNTQSSGSDALMPAAPPDTNINANPIMGTPMGAIAQTLATLMGAGVIFLTELSMIAKLYVTTGTYRNTNVRYPVYDFVQNIEKAIMNKVDVDPQWL